MIQHPPFISVKVLAPYQKLSTPSKIILISMGFSIAQKAQGIRFTQHLHTKKLQGRNTTAQRRIWTILLKNGAMTRPEI